MLGLPVAVLVRQASRTSRDADSEEREQRGDEVGPGVQRLREQPEAVRGEPSGELDRDQDAGGDDGGERDPALRRHARTVGPAVLCL